MATEQTITKIRSVSPHNKRVLAEFSCATEVDVYRAINRARRAYLSGEFDLNARLKRILALKSLIAENADKIANLISLEVGKPVSECLACEIAGVLDTCSWLARNTKRLLRTKRVKLGNPLFRGNRCYLEHEPHGVIGIISPWNFPFSIPMTSILAAVACGNTVVLKPSEKSSLLGLLIKDLFDTVGFPEGTVEVVLGDGSVGKCLSQSPNIDKMLLTGSVAAGQSLVGQTVSKLTPLILELGGKDAAIVLPDADIEFTARGLVWGAFMNAGQACASVERAYLVRGPRTEKLIDLIVAKTNALRVGSPEDPDTDVGPLIDEHQLEKVAAQVELASSSGATILTGGSTMDERGGFYYAPTVVTDVDEARSYMRDETFGPVLWIHVVDSVEEAIRYANRSKFGLTGSIWTNNSHAAQRIASQLKVGTVYVNENIFSHAAPELPWGGLKLSGIGRSHGEAGLMEMVRLKNTNFNTASSKGRLWWYPYSRRVTRALRGGVKFLHGPGAKDRVKGVCDFLTGLCFGKR